MLSDSFMDDELDRTTGALDETGALSPLHAQVLQFLGEDASLEDAGVLGRKSKQVKSAGYGKANLRLSAGSSPGTLDESFCGDVSHSSLRSMLAFDLAGETSDDSEPVELKTLRRVQPQGPPEIDTFSDRDMIASRCIGIQSTSGPLADRDMVASSCIGIQPTSDSPASGQIPGTPTCVEQRNCIDTQPMSGTLTFGASLGAGLRHSEAPAPGAPHVELQTLRRPSAAVGEGNADETLLLGTHGSASFACAHDDVVDPDVGLQATLASPNASCLLSRRSCSELSVPAAGAGIDQALLHAAPPVVNASCSLSRRSASDVVPAAGPGVDHDLVHADASCSLSRRSASDVVPAAGVGIDHAPLHAAPSNVNASCSLSRRSASDVVPAAGVGIDHDLLHAAPRVVNASCSLSMLSAEIRDVPASEDALARLAEAPDGYCDVKEHEGLVLPQPMAVPYEEAQVARDDGFTCQRRSGGVEVKIESPPLPRQRFQRCEQNVTDREQAAPSSKPQSARSQSAQRRSVGAVLACSSKSSRPPSASRSAADAAVSSVTSGDGQPNPPRAGGYARFSAPVRTPPRPPLAFGSPSATDSAANVEVGDCLFGNAAQGEQVEPPPSTCSRQSTSSSQRQGSTAAARRGSSVPRSASQRQSVAERKGSAGVMSNRKLVRNALEKNCLKGDAVRDQRARILRCFDDELQSYERFVILFRSIHTGRHDLRALYGLREKTWHRVLQELPSPPTIEERMVAQCLRYDSGGKEFREVPAQLDVLQVADAVFLHQQYLQKARVVGPP